MLSEREGEKVSMWEIHSQCEKVTAQLIASNNTIFKYTPIDLF